MNNFILDKPVDYVTELLRLVPVFKTSSAFASLDEEDRIMPGLVFSTFAKFFEESIHDRCALDQCRIALEYFASSNDPDAHNLLVTEVFESFRNPESAKSILLPQSRALFDTWMPSAG